MRKRRADSPAQPKDGGKFSEEEIAKALPSLLLLAKRKVGGTGIDPEDLAQETVYRILIHQKNHDACGSFCALGKVALRNVFFSTLHHNAPYRELTSVMEAYIPHPQPPADELVDTKQKFERLMDAVPNAEWKEILMRTADGETHGEIAKAYGIQEITVSTRVNRTRAAMKETRKLCKI